MLGVFYLVYLVLLIFVYTREMLWYYFAWIVFIIGLGIQIWRAIKGGE